LLPEIEKIVKNELGNTPVTYNYLSQTLTRLHESIEAAVRELTWFWKAKNEKVTGDSRESMQKAQGVQRQVIAHMKQYSREVAQMTKEQINFLKYLDVFKTRLPKHLKQALVNKSLSQENVNGLEGLEKFVMYDLSDIVGHNIPFLGVYKTYEAGDEKMAAVILGIDVYYLYWAVKLAAVALATGPIAAALVVARMFAADVLLGTALMTAMEVIKRQWDDVVDSVAPQLSNKHKHLDYIEQRGFKND